MFPPTVRTRRRVSFNTLFGLVTAGLTLSTSLAAQDEAPAAPLALDTPLPPTIVVRGEALPPAAARTLATHMAAANVPGVSVAVLVDGKVAWAAGFGLADVASERPVTTETLFQAASISKPVAAMAALTLVQEGALALDVDVNEVLTSWAVEPNALTNPEGGAPRPVTLRELLSHTAGLTVHGFPGYPRDAKLPTTVEVLEGAGNTPPVVVDLVPGTQYRYSGGGYTVAQLLMVDALWGEQTFPELMHARVLAPLGLEHSTYEQPLPAALHGRAATAYMGDGSPVPGGWHVYPEMAAAGLWTTPSDLARFAAAVQRGLAGEDGPTLEARWVREMTKPPVQPGYGLGLSLAPGLVGHGGSNMGFQCSLTAFTEGGDGAVIMTNAGGGGALLEPILFQLADHYGWSGLGPQELAAVDLGERLAAYAGTYHFEGFGDVKLVVAEPGDRLEFTLPDGESGILRAESESRFFDAADGERVQFRIDADSGAVTDVVWDGYEGNRVEAP